MMSMSIVGDRVDADAADKSELPGQFDFVLDGPMWEEYVHACTAYGRGARLFFMWGGPLLMVAFFAVCMPDLRAGGQSFRDFCGSLILSFLAFFLVAWRCLAGWQRRGLRAGL